MTMSAALEKIKEEVDKWESQKNRKLTQNQHTYVLRWSQAFLTLIVDKETAAPPATVSDWHSPKGNKNVEVAFIRHDQGFSKCTRSLATLVGTTPISLLVADSDYGYGVEEWDKVPWSNEFAETISFVEQQNGGLPGSNFCWFLTDKQLPVCLQAILDRGLSYKLCTWHKPCSVVQGPRFRHDHEFFLFAWSGSKENDFVCNIDSEDQPRYSTMHHQGRVSRHVLNFQGKIVNHYQKPIRLMKKILNMVCGKPKNLVVDVTCGTGTTAVSRFCTACSSEPYNSKCSEILSISTSQIAAHHISLDDEKSKNRASPRRFQVVLLDKLKAQIDAATLRLAVSEDSDDETDALPLPPGWTQTGQSTPSRQRPTSGTSPASGTPPTPSQPRRDLEQDQFRIQ